MKIHTPVFIRARALMGYRSLVESLGGDASALMGEVGIPMSVLEDPNATFPLDDMAALMDISARRLNEPEFGLRLAGHQDISVLGILAIIAQHSSSVREAVEGIARNLPYHTPGVSLKVMPGPGAGLSQLCYSIYLADDSICRHTLELSYAVAYGFLRQISASDASDWRIHFRHEHGLGPAGYERYFACPVLLGQSDDAIIFPSTLLDVKIDSTRSDLRISAERFLNHVIRRFPLDIGRQVEMLVDQQLAIGGGSIQRIAGQLGLQHRTLQRRLADQGLVFENIVDDVRRDRTEEFLPHYDIPLIQIAAMIGYNNQTSLNRSCLRWFGKPPTELRLLLKKNMAIRDK